MRKLIFITALFFIVPVIIANAQCSATKSTQATKPTSIGIVIYSNEPETVWNAFRLANYSIEQKDTVNIFLLGKGVELSTLDSKQFDVKAQTDIYLKSGAKILACGTCLQSRNISNPKVCSVSSMSDLYDMMKKSKIVMSF